MPYNLTTLEKWMQRTGYRAEPEAEKSQFIPVL